MKVFVTGATGYIGWALVTALRRAGHEAVGLSRHPRASAPGLDWVAGNLRDGRTYVHEASLCDAVVHLGFEPAEDAASVDREAIETLLAAARKSGSPRVFLYTSGCWVLGDTSDAPETSEASDTPADETDPLSHPAALVAFRPGHEKIVREAASPTLSTAVIRPGIVFGGRGGLTAGFFAAADAGELPTVVGDGHNRWTGVHLEDVADLYVRALEAGLGPLAALSAEERVLHAAVGFGERVGDMARAASRAAGGPDAVRFLSVAKARETYGPMAEALVLDQVVSATRSEGLLGWRPRVRGFIRNAPELFCEWKAAG